MLARVGLALLLSVHTIAQVLPPGFSDALIARIASPTALAFTPDERLLITTQGGTLRVFQNGQLLARPALTIPAARICSNSERGLLGVAVDPEFAANHFIYLYYTFRRPAPGDCSANTVNSPINRVSRFVLGDDSVIDLSTETALIDNIPSPNGNHNAGDLQFDADGYLYVSVGDGGCDYKGGNRCAGANTASRDDNTLLGKVLRIRKDGGIPSDNPFLGSNTARCNTGNVPAGIRCQETYAHGFRNPFRIVFDPNAAGVRFFINDVGQDAWEEIDSAEAGADYGWNIREGACVNGSLIRCSPSNPPRPELTDPVFSYPHNSAVPGTQSRGCNSITGGAFVPNGFWPPEFDSSFLFADFVCGSIFRLARDGSDWHISDFVRELGDSSVVTLRFGPRSSPQALYYTTYFGGGQVRRITYNGSEQRLAAGIRRQLRGRHPTGSRVDHEHLPARIPGRPAGIATTPAPAVARGRHGHGPR